MRFLLVDSGNDDNWGFLISKPFKAIFPDVGFGNLPLRGS